MKWYNKEGQQRLFTIEYDEKKKKYIVFISIEGKTFEFTCDEKFLNTMEKEIGYELRSLGGE